jgi:hypothetical protein
MPKKDGGNEGKANQKVSTFLASRTSAAETGKEATVMSILN